MKTKTKTKSEIKSNPKPRKASPASIKEAKSVSVEKVGKQYIVSTYTDKGQKKAICKNEKEMANTVKKMSK